jgi:hypothetical protein
MVPGPAGRAMQLKGLLPVVQPVVVAVPQKLVKLLLHRGRKIGQPGTFRQWLARIGRHGHTQNARGARVEGRMRPCGSSTITPAVRLSRMVCRLGARGIHRPHALLHRTPRIGQLLRHGGKGSGQSVQLVLALQGGLGAEVACGHLPHPFGQHQQRPRQLVAQQHRQQHRAKHRQKQASVKRAHVHAAQAPRARRAPGIHGWPLAPRWRWPPGRGQWHRDLQKPGLSSRPTRGLATSAKAFMRASA